MQLCPSTPSVNFCFKYLRSAAISPHLFAMASQCQKFLPLHALYYETRYSSEQQFFTSICDTGQLHAVSKSPCVPLLLIQKDGRGNLAGGYRTAMIADINVMSNTLRKSHSLCVLHNYVNITLCFCTIISGVFAVLEYHLTVDASTINLSSSGVIYQRHHTAIPFLLLLSKCILKQNITYGT
jgi:hypothetical protein